MKTKINKCKFCSKDIMSLFDNNRKYCNSICKDAFNNLVKKVNSTIAKGYDTATAIEINKIPSKLKKDIARSAEYRAHTKEWLSAKKDKYDGHRMTETEMLESKVWRCKKEWRDSLRLITK